MMITDFHTHAFPDSLADRAIAALQAETDQAVALLDGRVSSLLASMDQAGIDRSVICSIATKPSQFDPIMEWSLQIASERIIPFASVHPRDPDLRRHVQQAADAGIKGIKVHPYYQDFYLCDRDLASLYRAVADCGLLLVSHTGFDIAFPRIRRCDPRQIVAVCEAFPTLTFVTTHLGSWMDWDEVEAHIIGKPIYMETSFALNKMSPERARTLLKGHPVDYLLYGSDSPWTDQSAGIRDIKALQLGAPFENAILEGNAARLLDRADGI